MPTKSFPRLEKAFARQGIQLARDADTVWLTRTADQTRAAVLLPASFPIEEKAVRQLLDFAAVSVPGHPGRVLRACATPDFHPGSIAPVGAVVATTADLVIPAAVGTDINCGMRLLHTGLSLESVNSQKDRLLHQLSQALLHNHRDVPMFPQSFQTLFDEGPQACLDNLPDTGLWGKVDLTRLAAELASCIGLSQLAANAAYAPAALIDGKRELLRDPALGTPGSGNHFVELQVVDALLDRQLAYQHGLQLNEVVVMIHSGSRDVGFHIGQRWMDKARAAWPSGTRHPASGLYGLTGVLAGEYLQAMGVAARYAWLNRSVLAEMVRAVWREVFGCDDSALVVDVPHNIVLPENGLNIHRKGSTPAHCGDLALIPGSMGDYSYVAAGLGHADWLHSCSHGAGRSMRRQAARRAQQPTAELTTPWQCMALRQDRLREEAPGAYKPVGPVIEVQQRAGLIHPVARLRPWVTFKA